MTRIRSSRRLVWLAGCFSVVALAGCPTSQPATQLSLDQFGAQTRDAICAWAVGCHLVADTATCRAYDDAADAALAPIRASIAAGRMTYDADQAAACLDAMRALTCRFDESLGGRGFQAACGTVFAGSVATDGTCYQSQECVAGDTCNQPAGCSPSTMCCAGTCVVSSTTRPVPIGGACAGSFECVAGAYCFFGSTGGTCTAQAAAGQPCSGFDSCVAGTACVSGSCHVTADAGQPCGPTAPCARIDNYCDPSSLICVTLPIEGQPCTAGGQCVLYAYCDAGTCRVRPAVGEACTAASGCQFTYSCPASGVCEGSSSQPVCP